MGGQGVLARGLAVLTLGAALVLAQRPVGEDNPVKFGPVPTFPPQGEQYEPRGVLRSVEKPHQLLGILLAALVVLISSGAKIGGGAVLDAVYILVLKLGPDEAIPLASITVFGGAVCDFFLNLWKKPINSNFPLINWDFMLIMQPMLLMGAAFGASMISWFSTWLLTIALIVYLVYVGKKAFKKARAVGHEEGWRWCSSSETMSLLGAPSMSFQDDDGSFQYKSGLSWRKLGINFGIFTATVLLTALQGGRYFPSPLGIPPTSFFFLIVSMLPFIFLSVVSHYQMKDAVATYQRQQNPRFILAPNEVQWSPDAIRKIPLRLLGIGAIAGAFGVGGEGATSSLLRGVNFTPAAVSAMSATAVFFVSGMASFDFLLWGKLDLNLAKFLMPLGFMMTLLGRLCLIRIVRKAKSRTLLLFAIAAAMFISIFPLAFMELRGLFGF
ncbi:uncharacterized protein PITG_03822 [Phytophthora infestans T30-4]|uniref:Transmembrane protein n=2 Tax=Phytophthora infestans TaxID=4787 RepID=D0MYL7_PHYIT|nr:uncharacterized protein PITG_03822 [Phytophthora infestans T30-4]EEY66265.1 conserved hypothetical protein [Phytophthora infestans T30-4]KAF4040600.1 Sulfite exporter TauE/SafE [Phytophthora infestans]KAF4135204.1 Sulfite exporter TauE/SafE [Phytophthora infestans]|eukprot:XP_002906864.1 conserved hypothetical protein [Phytophthora infestans T30-4]